MSNEKFDLVTHKREAKSGQIASVNAYTLHIKDGVRRFERPKKSGMFYSEDGVLDVSMGLPAAEAAAKKSLEAKEKAAEAAPKAEPKHHAKEHAEPKHHESKHSSHAAHSGKEK